MLTYIYICIYFFTRNAPYCGIRVHPPSSPPVRVLGPPRTGPHCQVGCFRQLDLSPRPGLEAHVPAGPSSSPPVPHAWRALPPYREPFSPVSHPRPSRPPPSPQLRPAANWPPPTAEVSPSGRGPRRLTTQARRLAGAGRPVPGSGRRPLNRGEGRSARRAPGDTVAPPQSPIKTLRRHARIPRCLPCPAPRPPPRGVRPSPDPAPYGPISPHYILSDITWGSIPDTSVKVDKNF
jgi:hypothetical protein